MDFMTGRRELDEIDAFEQERAATKTGPWNKFLSVVGRRPFYDVVLTSSIILGQSCFDRILRDRTETRL